MKNILSPFHLAFPVKNLADTKEFYRDILGCSLGRTNKKWIDFNFLGHQITAHLSPESFSLKEPKSQFISTLLHFTFLELSIVAGIKFILPIKEAIKGELAFV